MISVYRLKKPSEYMCEFRIESDHNRYVCISSLDQVFYTNPSHNIVGLSASKMTEQFELIAQYQHMNELLKNIKIDLAEEFI